MEAAVRFFGALAMAAAIGFAACLSSTCVGAIGGWVVGLLFDDTIAGGLRAFHIGALQPWQLGAFLGFCGAFFKSTLTAPSK